VATVRRSFTLDDERDAALLAWLDAQSNASEAIRGALRATVEPTGATLGDVLHAIERLGGRLDGLHVTTAPTPEREEEDPELAAALEALGV
jgi:hypothetical protein